MHTTRVAWLSADGIGVGHTEDGRLVSLPGTVPGDVVSWSTSERRGRDERATDVTVVEPSPDRVTPACPWDASCGGCDLSALSTSARHTTLGKIVGHALRWEGPLDVVPSPRATGHRARITLALHGTAVGYHASRSHTLVEPDVCAAARPELNVALTRLRAWLATHGATPWSDVELRSDGTRVVFAFSGRADGGTRPSRETLAELGDVAVDGRVVAGDPVLRVGVAGLSLRCSPGSFYQVNLEANEGLVAYVGAQVAAAAPERLLDLYAGIGNLGLPVAARGVPVVAVERDGTAIHDLRTTAAELGLKVEALALPAERFDPSRTPFDVAVLDPARAGAGEVLARVLRNRPRRVVYVSCNVVAAARDLREFAKGWTVSAVRAFDLFPDTHHVEAVITLDRGR